MRKAIFSPCEKYRYTLWREWHGLFGDSDFRYVNFICLNPSTATDTVDDRTIAKCTKLGKMWGYDALCVTNIFAYRSTNPLALLELDDPIGPDNDKHILGIAAGASLIIAAWSQHSVLLERGAHVRQLLKLARQPVFYLEMGAKGPKHPLYLREDIKPVLWQSL